MEWNNLRPFQKKAVSLLRKEWKNERTHQLYAACAFGKTAFASYLVKSFIEKGERVLFVAPYTVLVEQTAKRFEQYGLPKSGIIWRDHPDYDPSALIQIASADTLIRRDFPREVKLMLIDESHIKRKKLLEIIAESDFPVVGLSGTPFPEWMGEYYKTLIKPCTMRELIDVGDLSDYDMFIPESPDMTGVRTSNTAGFGSDYVESGAAKVMEKPVLVGNIVKNWLENGENRPTIAFCCNVSHANIVTLNFQSAGVAAEVMTAATKKEERDAIVSRFEGGITKIICNVGVLVAGFDSDVRAIIYARPTKSLIRWIQCLARGFRTAEGKDRCLVFDHSGSYDRLGLPCEIEFDHLNCGDDGMKMVQRKQKEKDEHGKVSKVCSNCKLLKDPGVYICPKCGHKPLAGEDVETDETRGLTKVKGKKKVYTKDDKQQFWSELKGYQKEYKCSDGRIAHLYKGKFGVWPRGIKDEVKPAGIDTRNFIKSRNIAYAKAKKKNEVN